MCAINGCTGDEPALVGRMNAATAHRGPDGTALWQGDGVTLGHNRLAIIDLSPAAAQPMVSASGRFVITYNGELYNYRALRAQLSAYPFKSHSDTEVLLAAFETWGARCFKKFDGMFALAIWDRELRTLTLARDQSGIKPLYYSLRAGRLVFSSELKGLLADERFERVVDREALEMYLRVRYVPAPLTMWRDAKKFPPASYGVFKDGELTVTEYFNPPLVPLSHAPPREQESRIREFVDGSVKRELVADRPVGLFLSGGLDSTIVLDCAASAGPVETFSLAFELSPDEQAEKFNEDARLARLSAEHYGARHHEVTLSGAAFASLLPDVVSALDQPVGNATAAAQYVLAREARKKIVVALTGEGGDELFGGYPRYRLSLLMDRYQHFPKTLRSFASALSSRAGKLDTPGGLPRTALFMFEKDATLARVLKPEFFSRRAGEWFDARFIAGKDAADPTQLLMDTDRRSWLAEEALARTDAMTMASSLEARVPLLSPELILYASNIPAARRIGWGGKDLMRRAFAGRLPEHVLAARKRGFFSPIAKWLRRPEVLALARETLGPAFHPPTDAVLDFAGCERLLEDHVAKKGYAATELFTLIALRLWAKQNNATL